jgi:6-phosphofructo-2-kinase.
MSAFALSLKSINPFISVFTVSEYRRKFVEQYDSHDLFRADNHEAMEIRKKSSVAAMEDAAQWLKEEGNVAVSNSVLKILKLFRTSHI